MIRYQARIKKDGDSYFVEFPDLPGCFSEGEDREEALENAREALSLYLEEARDPDWNVPRAKNRSGRGFVWVRPFESVAVPLMIRRARIKSGLSQRQLAGRLGITVQQLQKLEAPGKANPTVKTLAAISAALSANLEISFAA